MQIAIFTPLSAYQGCQSACRLALPLLLILPIGAAKKISSSCAQMKLKLHINKAHTHAHRHAYIHINVHICGYLATLRAEGLCEVLKCRQRSLSRFALPNDPMWRGGRCGRAGVASHDIHWKWLPTFSFIEAQDAALPWLDQLNSLETHTPKLW